MALSPFSKKIGAFNRGRSSSLSSPVTNQFVYHQEIYTIGKNTLIRSFSCGQFFNSDQTGQTFQSTQIQVSNFITPTKKIPRSAVTEHKPSTVPKKWPAIEYPKPKRPSKAKLSLNFADNRAGVTEKDKNLPEVYDSVDTMKTTSCHNLKKYIKYLVPLLVSILIFVYLRTSNCSYYNNSEQLTVKLKNLVFGQREAITKIGDLMTKFDTMKEPLILSFTGGVGVGKSYTSSVIGQFFNWDSVDHISFINSAYTTNHALINRKFSSCSSNLVIIDDISVLSCMEAIKFVQSLLNESVNGKLMVIMIFQTFTKEQKDLILLKLKSSFVDFHHIPFKSLKKDDILQCFKMEILRLKVEIPKEELDQLIMEQMNYIDVLKGSPGCKGITDEVSRFYNQSD